MPEKTSSPAAFGRGSRLSAACGLWMLLGGVAGAIWLAWERNGWWVDLPLGYVGVIGALLLLESRRPRAEGRRPAADGPPGTIVTAPEKPAAADAPGAAGPGWRLPIWLHLILQVIVTVPGFFGGAMLGFCTASLLIMGLVALFRPAEARPAEPEGWGPAFGSCCVFLIGAPLFFGGAALGGGQAQRLLLHYVSGRCPACGGSASCQLGKPITYHCRSCGHVHATMVSAR